MDFIFVKVKSGILKTKAASGASRVRGLLFVTADFWSGRK
jgi:hypothetical protein